MDGDAAQMENSYDIDNPASIIFEIGNQQLTLQQLQSRFGYAVAGAEGLQRRYL